MRRIWIKPEYSSSADVCNSTERLNHRSKGWLWLDEDELHVKSWLDEDEFARKMTPSDPRSPTKRPQENTRI